MSAIDTKSLTFTYENRTEPALDNVSLSIEEREFLLLAGASGSGKSTLIKCVNGLIPHRYVGEYTGQVLVRGQRVSDSKLIDISLMVGTVLQEADKQLVAPFVEDDVAFGPSNLALPRNEIEARIEDSLGSMGIEQLRRRSVYELSGGQKQRLAIADVLAMRPDILLFDEPLANLDSAGIRLMLDVFARLREQRKTIVVAEHRTEEVLRSNPSRVVVFQAGRLVADSTNPEVLVDFADVLKTPAEYAVRKKIGSSSMHEASIESLLSVPSALQQLESGPPPRRAELVRIENLTFDYPGGTRALKNVSMAIQEGERIALLGNNGAGKSTLALNLVGLLKPTMGRVLVDGKDTQAQSVEDIVATVAIVFQNPFSMIFAKTVYDELAFGPKNVGLPPDDISDLIPIVAEQCGVTQLLDKSPFASSFGEKKRICVGAVLTMRPKCIILDEPTAGQDYRSYTEFMKFIRSLSDKGHAFVLITHDTDLAIEYADRTVILNDGRIVADGPTRRILADPKTLTDNAIRETSLVEISRKLTNGQFVFSLSDLLGMVNGTKTRS